MSNNPSPVGSVTINQAYNANIRVNVVPSNGIPAGLNPLTICKPRQGAPRTNAEALDLPKETVEKLNKASKSIVSWLAKDESNMKLFITDPVTALHHAEVKLEKEELKAIMRMRTELSAHETVQPGLKLKTVELTANPNGKIKPVENAKSDCGCNHNRKEQ